MSKYIYPTVYEEFTGLKPPEPTEAKQRRKRGYGHPYRMRLNIQESEVKPAKKPERRNQFGQPISSTRKSRDTTKETKDRYEYRPHNDEFPAPAIKDKEPLFNTVSDHKESASATTKVTYKKRRKFSLEQHSPNSQNP